ncbi:MAG: heparan-alpha-glucosaminide N-acetyltransferase domain-containing protein [Edaphobacter sp.]
MSQALAQPSTAPAPIRLGATSRILSVDVLRGLTIALMILVNDPGDWAHTYTQLDHAAWNGFTLTDLVFPNFLFLVGASIIFSLQSRLARGDSKKTLAFHILRRSAIIFALDLFFGLYPHFHYTHLRIFGVLTRIALCYLVAGIICLATQRVRALAAIAAALLIGYWALMRFVPVPGFGIPTHNMPILDPDGNLAAWLDRHTVDLLQRTLHTGRLYNHTRDPEGLLSTIPAIATTLIGCITGLWLRRVETRNEYRTPSSITPARCLSGLTGWSLLSVTAAIAWNHSFPINKNLWTSSYVLYSASWSLLTLAFCYWFIDIRRFNETKAGKWLTFPWLVFGSNAIVAFCVSEFIVINMIWIKIPGSVGPTGNPVTAWYWVYHNLFAFNGSTNVTSLVFAIAFVVVCFLPNWLLYRKRIFLRI